ncbi:MAG: hypothetical protein HC799_18000 [Limnothrix sp. RL_2_0]|nr:hypothetical protein [Limnothrix sp. RL_2_0]
MTSQVAENLLFSQFSSKEFEVISDILSSLFTTSKIELTALYKRLNDDFDNSCPSPIFVDRAFFTSMDEGFQAIYAQSPVIAVDLPSILELDNGDINKPTVVILGQDPKNDHDFENIIVGTPYALHSKECRIKHTKRYFEMVFVLLSLGYRVYLTDIFKVWVCDPTRPYSRCKLPRIDQEKFFHILKLEFQAVKPVALITWGNEAANSLSSVNIEVPHLKFLHPGGAANGAWKRLLGKSPTDANKLEYWKTRIFESLSGLGAIEI